MSVNNAVEIKEEFLERRNQLEQQIDHLNNFITDLISHKLSLENANRQLEQLARAEKDSIKKSKYFAAIRNNIELLTKVFNSISELESIKHRYHKEINDITIGKYKLIDKSFGNNEENLSEFFEKLTNIMSSSSGKEQRNLIKSNLEKDPDYKL